MKTYDETTRAEQLEGMIDRVGVGEVLQTLAVILREKADHIRSNWQDETMARHFEYKATLLDKTAEKIGF